MPETASETHNRLATALVMEIVQETRATGGPTSTLVLLESIVAGVLTAVVKRGGDEAVWNQFQAGVKGRIIELRNAGF